jgi:hypothetical protein
MKYRVRYRTDVTFEGTIEADSLVEAQKQWDEGFTPFDESEVDRSGSDEELILLEEIPAKASAV